MGTFGEKQRHVLWFSRLFQHRGGRQCYSSPGAPSKPRRSFPSMCKDQTKSTHAMTLSHFENLDDAMAWPPRNESSQRTFQTPNSNLCSTDESSTCRDATRGQWSILADCRNRTGSGLDCGTIGSISVLSRHADPKKMIGCTKSECNSKLKIKVLPTISSVRELLVTSGERRM
jgi:hypothetical protein